MCAPYIRETGIIKYIKAEKKARSSLDSMVHPHNMNRKCHEIESDKRFLEANIVI